VGCYSIVDDFCDGAVGGIGTGRDGYGLDGVVRTFAAGLDEGAKLLLMGGEMTVFLFELNELSHACVE
jgi:hypothetical protein